MITVEIRKLRLFAYHGLFPEERKTGNEFEINLAVSYLPQKERIDAIADTVNYARLFQLVKEEFQTPTALLETLAMAITGVIREEFPFVKKISLSIDKLHPPITGFTGQVGVKYEKEY